VFDAVAYQLGIFQAIALRLDVQPNHVKPHGALYNMAVRDENWPMPSRAPSNRSIRS
jgi:lactam utilization protein B